jgi:hypothetical protein
MKSVARQAPVGHGRSGFGPVWLGTSGLAFPGLGEASLCLVSHGWLRFGSIRQSRAPLFMAQQVPVWHDRLGQGAAGPGGAGRVPVRRGRARPGSASLRLTGQDFTQRGKSGPGLVRRDESRLRAAILGPVWRGRASHGSARQRKASYQLIGTVRDPEHGWGLADHHAARDHGPSSLPGAAAVHSPDSGNPCPGSDLAADTLPGQLTLEAA